MNDRSTESTTVVATFASLRDAEGAKRMLAGRGIVSFVVADEGRARRPGAEGVRLLVLNGDAPEARTALGEAAAYPQGWTGTAHLRRKQDAYDGWGYTIGLRSGITRWFYTTALVFVLAAMAFLVLFGTVA